MPALITSVAALIIFLLVPQNSFAIQLPINEAEIPKGGFIPIITDNRTPIYYKIDRKIFYRTCSDENIKCFKEIPNSYPESFTLIDSQFAKDARRVYFEGSAIRGMHPKNFKVLSDYYATDGKKISYMHRVLKNAQASSFSVIKQPDSTSIDNLDWTWSSDNSHVFYKQKIVNGLDQASFQILSASLVKDRQAVFCNSHKLPNVDSLSFTRINGIYAKDKNHGFLLVSSWLTDEMPCRFFILEDADPKTLKAVTKGDWMYENFAIDKKHIYLDGKIIATTESFNTLDIEKLFKEKNVNGIKGLKSYLDK